MNEDALTSATFDENAEYLIKKLETDIRSIVYLIFPFVSIEIRPDRLYSYGVLICASWFYHSNQHHTQQLLTLDPYIVEQCERSEVCSFIVETESKRIIDNIIDSSKTK